jgi:DNA recombination protein RmuC
MEAFLAPLILLAGVAIGAAGAWWLRGREFAAERVAHAERIASLSTLRADFEQTLKSLATDALDGSQKSFLQLADQAFARHRDGAAASLDERQKGIAALLAPLTATLSEYRQRLTDLERAREAAYGGLSAEVKLLAQAQADASAQTRRLVTALQAAPKTRGRWGEQQLHNVLELSGMTLNVDFTTEQTIDLDDNRLRPDVVIRLPGERRIVVDAKTSMAAYLDAVEAVDDEAREAHLSNHARQLRTHMRQLAAKAYWEALPFTPDFVVMFIPGENFFAAAIERDPQLFEDAIASRVLIVTPTTLIALAKAIAFGWRQEKVADNARQVAELGRELYRRLATMGDHIMRLGQGLDGAVRHYNNFVGSLESRVMPQARRFSELEVDGTRDPLPDLKPADTKPRLLRTDDAEMRDAGVTVLPTMAAVRAE